MSHWNRGFVTKVCASIAASRSTTPAPSHRPGCRTGTALISSGGPVRPAVCAVRGVVTLAPDSATGGIGSARGSANRGVDRRVGDGAALHSPFLQDLHVGAFGHEMLHGGQHWVGHPAVLGDRNPVRRGAVG